MERTFSPLHTPTAAFSIGGNNGSLDLGSLVDLYQTGLGPWRAFQHTLAMGGYDDDRLGSNVL
eukprot:scaffold364960_cov63-Attheya_sp.AAC.1